MRTFKLTDNRTLSGQRLRRDQRRVEGGGYIDPTGGPSAPLLPAHGKVPVQAAGLKKGEKEVPNAYNRSS